MRFKFREIIFDFYTIRGILLKNYIFQIKGIINLLDVEIVKNRHSLIISNHSMSHSRFDFKRL